jgi:hypothetical protein
MLEVHASKLKMATIQQVPSWTVFNRYTADRFLLHLLCAGNDQRNHKTQLCLMVDLDTTPIPIPIPNSANDSLHFHTLVVPAPWPSSVIPAKAGIQTQHRSSRWKVGLLRKSFQVVQIIQLEFRGRNRPAT